MMSQFARAFAVGATVASLGLAPASLSAQELQFGPVDSAVAKPRKSKPAVEHLAPGTLAAPAAATGAATGSSGAEAVAATGETGSSANNAKPGASKYTTSGLPPPPKPANCKNTRAFESWLAAFKKDARAEGISDATINAALGGARLDPGVISRDRKQGFFAQSFTDFSRKLATQNRVTNGRAKIKANAAAFQRAVKDYGVAPSVITGFWALESDFGAGMGKLQILKSLITLAYDCRRGDMFEVELMAALRIIDRGDMTPETMIGSWAGEIGQTQFLPTRYLEHAIDYDGDDRIDLFSNDTDIIGSTANYMKHLGWRAGEPWIEEVRLTKDLPWDKADLQIKLPRSQWAAWGVEKSDGAAMPQDDMPASLLLPMGRFGPAFLAYQNFDVYLQWNQSLNYAVTAAWLATRIDGAPPMQKPTREIAVLAPEEAKELQRLLQKRGFDVGEIDGKIGSNTRKAVKTVQIEFGLPADSYPTPELLAALRGAS